MPRITFANSHIPATLYCNEKLYIGQHYLPVLASMHAEQALQVLDLIQKRKEPVQIVVADEQTAIVQPESELYA